MRLFACVVLLSACSFRVPGIDVPEKPSQADSPGPPVVDAMLPTPFDAAMATPLDMTMLQSPPDMKMPPPSSHVGDPCVALCGGGLVCMPWGLFGYCTKPCGACPMGSQCADLGEGMQYCLEDFGAGGCNRPDLECRKCGGQVCAPSTFCEEC